MVKWILYIVPTTYIFLCFNVEYIFWVKLPEKLLFDLSRSGWVIVSKFQATKLPDFTTYLLLIFFSEIAWSRCSTSEITKISLTTEDDKLIESQEVRTPFLAPEPTLEDEVDALPENLRYNWFDLLCTLISIGKNWI